MIIKWLNGKKKDHLAPKLNEIYMNTTKDEIMLMNGNYFSNGKSYFQYQTFKDDSHSSPIILQDEFLKLREEEKIVKIEITTVEFKRIY